MVIPVKLMNGSSHMRAPEIYSPSIVPVFNTVLLTTVIVLYITSLHLFILHNCDFVPNISPFSAPLHPW